MPTATETHSIAIGGTTLSTQSTFTGTLLDIPAEACATGATTVINCPLDVSAVKAFGILSTKAVTVKTNSASSPDNTIVLAANVGYFWTNVSQDTFKLTTDVVTLHIVNASGASADVAVAAILDSTP